MTGRAARITAFLHTAEWQGADRTHIAGDASNRRYERVRAANGKTVILMDAPPDHGEDVGLFIKVADHLRDCGLSTPRILARDISSGLLLLEDFGDALFADLMAHNAAQEMQLYHAAADVLIHLHQAPNPELPVCDAAWLTEMISPIFEWYAPEATPEQISQFRACFDPFLNAVANTPNVMILRDYHAQNLLLLGHRTGIARVGILDFQDALLGHPAYDLVSILQDARRDVRPDIEDDIINYMLARTNHDPASFRSAYAVLGLQRNLRILGIFARLCLRDGKAHYVDFIPRVWAYVERNLAHPGLAELRDHLRSLLPYPTPAFLEQLKRQCPPQNSLL